MPFLYIFALAIGQTDDGKLPTASELETRIRTSREALKFGYLEMSSECSSHDARGETMNEKALRQIWFDERRLRITWVGKIPMFQDREVIKHLCVPYTSAHDYLAYTSVAEVTPVRVLINTQDPKKNFSGILTDPRALGLHPSPMYRFRAPDYELQGLLARANYQGSTRATIWKGQKAYEIVYTALEDRLKAINARLRIIVVPGMDYSIPELEGSNVHDGRVEQWIMHVESAQFGNSKRWYPRKLDFRHLSNGKLVEQDRTEVMSADFDKRPTDRAFRLAAMNIPAGTPVVINFDGKSREWNGKEIVEKKLAANQMEAQFQDLPPVVRGNWSSPWLWTAGAISVAGAAFFYNGWRRRRQGVA